MMAKPTALLALVGLLGLVQMVICEGANSPALEGYFSQEEIKSMKPQVIEALREAIAERQAQSGAQSSGQKQEASETGDKEKQQPCRAISYRNQSEQPADLKGKTKANVEYQCRFCCRDHQFKFSYTTWDGKRHCHCTDSLLRKMFGVIEINASS